MFRSVLPLAVLATSPPFRTGPPAAPEIAVATQHVSKREEDNPWVAF